MTKFNVPVRDYMVAPVFKSKPTDHLSDVDRTMRELDISALPVVDSKDTLVGVISRTDLLRAGRVRVQTNGRRQHLLTLPDAKVREVMEQTVEVVTPSTTLSEAARRMNRARIHRLYVAEDSQVQGVVSTQEMMQAIADANIRIPLEGLMSTGVVSAKADEPLSLGIDRIAAARHPAIVVMDDEWPVGIFSQAEALASQEAPPDHPIAEWMNTQILCLPTRMPVSRAAQQAISTGARTILAVDREQVRGIVSGTDFTQLVKA